MRAAVIALISRLGAAQTGGPAPATHLSDAGLTATLKETAKTAPDMHTAPRQAALFFHQLLDRVPGNRVAEVTGHRLADVD